MDGLQYLTVSSDAVIVVVVLMFISLWCAIVWYFVIWLFTVDGFIEVRCEKCRCYFLVAAGGVGTICVACSG